MNKLLKTSFILLCVANILPSMADNSVSSQKPVMLKAETNAANMEMVIKDNFVKAKFASAENRFLQGNVKASHDDYADLISRAAHDDYVFLMYGIKMAEYGFFDLSNELFSRLDTNLYTQNYLKDIKRFYYPSGMVNAKDTIYLADAYASIVYNNLAIETTSELLNSTQAAESDYKNYLIALGFYKSNNLPQAIKYINNAITENDVNINYKILKAKILADANKPKQAIKVLNEVKKAEFLTLDFQDKIKAAEEYVEYKVAKEDALKDYHLSYYYHLQDKSLLATKVLQSSIISSKQYAPQIFGLLGKVYYDNDEPLKAQEFAQRAYRENKKNYLAVQTLADLSYDSRNYEEALKYYKEAKSLTKEVAPSIGIAKSYVAMDNDKKSKKIYEKLIKKHPNNEDLLAESLKVFPQRADDYLARIAAVDVSNNEIWLGLANQAIKDGNYSMAETYLNNSYYVDENNFRYYYYLSLVYRAKGDI
jgi:tetratricopeptide (TPR) repeat protein